MPALDPRNIEVIDPRQAAVLRTKTMAERVAMIGALNRTARLMMAAVTRMQHRCWTEEQIASEVARRMSRGE